MNNSEKINEKAKEAMMVRGICAAIQAMSMPTFNNLNDLLSRFGYTLSKKETV